MFALICVVGCKSQDEREREAWIAHNCPGEADYETCRNVVRTRHDSDEAKRKEAAAHASASAPAASATIPPVSSAPPLTSQERARLLAAVSVLKSMIGPRQDKLHNETDEECAAHNSADVDRVSATLNKLGEERRKQKTRFSERAPDLGQTVEAIVFDCLTGCIILRDPAPGELDQEKAQARRQCMQASTALDDIAAEVRPH